METDVKPKNRRIFIWLVLAVTFLFFAGIVWLFSLLRSIPIGPANKTTISHSVAVEKVEQVAKLVSSEVTLRDVVIYENSWYGSTKRSLVVVTGKLLAGINLDAGSSVEIDEKEKRVTINLPQPGIIAIEITEMKTYDEQRGYWNPFDSSDRDAIFRLAREQLEKTATELSITETAKQSASKLLEAMFKSEEYTAEVVYR